MTDYIKYIPDKKFKLFPTCLLKKKRLLIRRSYKSRLCTLFNNAPRTKMHTVTCSYLMFLKKLCFIAHLDKNNPLCLIVS